MKESTKKWLALADGDIEMAEAALQRSLPAQSLFHSQQAAEKTLKAVWSEGHEEEPPRTHNLVDLASELGLLAEESEDFLRKLSNQAVASRYIDSEEYSEEMAVEYLSGTRELCDRLRQRLK